MFLAIRNLAIFAESLLHGSLFCLLRHTHFDSLRFERTVTLVSTVEHHLETRRFSPGFHSALAAS